jgi:hypothetical protein
MPKKSEHKKYSKKSASKKHTKKNYENKNSIKVFTGGFPPANILSQFQISDENIEKFRRLFATPTDCVINAMQIIGMLDNLTGNLLRISLPENTTINSEQIEKIFTLYTGKFFNFTPTNDFLEFSNYLRTNLKSGQVAFAGYTKIDNTSHVFLLGRLDNGTIMYIDPQANAFCDIERPQCANLISNSVIMWHLLHHSEDQLSPEELRSMGFTI